MENKNEVFNDDKINKNLLIFDKGFNDIQELSSKKKLIEISIKKRKFVGMTYILTYLKIRYLQNMQSPRKN
jgi:hypothetical protein